MPKSTFFNLPEAKRLRVVEAAIDEFAARGYKGASITRMVAAAGIAKGSFYQYFEDLDDLYRHIVTTYIADRKLDTYQRERERLEELTLTEYLRVVFHQQVREFHRQPQLLKIALDFMKLADQPIFRRIMGDYQPAANTYFIPFIQHEVEQGEIDPAVNVQLLNFMLVSLGQYMIHRYTAADIQNIDSPMVDEIVDDLEYILTNGIYTDLVKNGRARHSE